ncbi:MAG: ATPase [Spirochaetes bacterium]|nr:MAG: ATPase [Spirochaetota bacterium]
MKTVKETDSKVIEAHSIVNRCRDEIAKRIIGQEKMVSSMLMGLIAGGHVLIEGVPGLAKTLAVKTLSEVLDVSYKRIQFTPDLLPADLIGTMVYRQESGKFTPRKGPVFSNIVLADEINRAPAKVQSALLEAMQEQQVTIGDETYKLKAPFFVLATQNPIEHEGTYPLPEAQLDRFILKLSVGYPDMEEELEILNRMGDEKEIPVSKVLNPAHIETLKKTARNIKIDSRVESYIVSIAAASRPVNNINADFMHYIEFGASPRASIFLHRCSKINALFNKRDYVVPEDVKSVVHEVLRHRIILNYEAESEGLTTDIVIDEILKFVQVP